MVRRQKGARYGHLCVSRDVQCLNVISRVLVTERPSVMNMPDRLGFEAGSAAAVLEERYRTDPASVTMAMLFQQLHAMELKHKDLALELKTSREALTTQHNLNRYCDT